MGDLVTRRHPAFDRIGGHGAREHHDVDRREPSENVLHEPPYPPRSLSRSWDI
jgi:hypothetical protein